MTLWCVESDHKYEAGEYCGVCNCCGGALKASLVDRVKEALANARANGFLEDATIHNAEMIAIDMITCDCALEDEDPDEIYKILTEILPK